MPDNAQTGTRIKQATKLTVVGIKHRRKTVKEWRKKKRGRLNLGANGLANIAGNSGPNWIRPISTATFKVLQASIAAKATALPMFLGTWAYSNKYLHSCMWLQLSRRPIV